MLPRDLVADAEADATGRAVLDVGGPATGRTWSVRRVNIGPAVPSGTLSGTARLYVGAVPYAGDPSGAEQRDQTTTFPNPGTWSHWSLPVAAPDHLFAIVTGATPGVGTVLTVSVEEYEPRERLGD